MFISIISFRQTIMRKFVLFALLLTFFISGDFKTSAQTDENMYQAKVRAPELAGGKSWLNTDKPLSLAGLKGKIVSARFLDLRLYQLHSYHSRSQTARSEIREKSRRHRRSFGEI